MSSELLYMQTIVKWFDTRLKVMMGTGQCQLAFFA